MIAFAISRVTLYAFLLSLLLATGIRLWYIQQRDDCARYLAGDKSFPSSQAVASGTRTIIVPCNQWLPRQPEAVQLLCLLDLLLATVFAMNALADLRNWLIAWQQSKRASKAGWNG